MLSFALGQFFHQLQLDLLNLEQRGPVLLEQVVELFVQVADFQFGLEVDLAGARLRPAWFAHVRRRRHPNSSQIKSDLVKQLNEVLS